MERRTFLKQSAALSGLTLAGWLSLGELEGRAPAWSAPAASKIDWKHDLREAHELGKTRSRPVLIVFTAKWCNYCHKLVKEVSADLDLAKLINREFVPTLLDFDKESHAAKVLEVEVLPTTVVLSPEVELKLFKSGYVKADQFRKLLESTLETNS